LWLNVLDLQTLVTRWSYAAIFLGLVLGNLGLPVPEETILFVAGYATSRGTLWLPAVLVIGMVSAVLGDNLGYWLGRWYGREMIGRCSRFVGIRADQIDRLSGLVARYGAIAVFAARFVPGLRFLGGPLAGAGGLSPVRFALANTLGALVYVPYAVGLGYAVGYGLGERLHQIAGGAETLVGAAAILAIAAWLAVRRRRARRALRQADAPPVGGGRGDSQTGLEVSAVGADRRTLPDDQATP
jgi:membrane protein DedA with SNARE-associated domain